MFVKNVAKPKEIVKKNKCGNPDSTNNSFAHPEEMLDNETLQATTRSVQNGRGQAKAKTFCADMQEKLEEDKLMKHLVISDKATFHTNGKVNEHHVRIWGE